MSHPIHARDFLRIKLDFFVERAAQRVQHSIFNRAAQSFRIDHQSAVMRANQSLHPHVARLSIHFDFGDLRDNGLAPERICESAARQNVSGGSRFRLR